MIFFSLSFSEGVFILKLNDVEDPSKKIESLEYIFMLLTK